MTERVIKLTLAYDGTDFTGWQRQKDCRTVQEELEKALGKMHGHPVSVMGAGRTDSGVHAAGQVAHFVTDIRSIPAGRFELALNKLMPQDVRIVSAEEADPDFHARYDARLRRYKYFMYASGPSLPHRDRFAWRLQKWPDLSRLNRLASCLHGEIDCTAFAAAKDPSENRFRYLHHAAFHAEGDVLVFEIAANAFLWRMVRSIVGTLVQLDREGAPESAMRDILLSRDRERVGVTAPARGLFLWNVEYYDRPTRQGRRLRPLESNVATPTAGHPDRLVPGIGWIRDLPISPTASPFTSTSTSTSTSLPLVTAVIFDLDGTLIDSEPVYWANDQVFLARYGIDFTEELNETMFGWGAVDFFARLQELFPLSPLNSMPLAERLRLKDEAYLEYGKDKIHSFPGVATFARWLIAQGVPVAIASGSSPLAIERTLEYAGLGGLFPVRVSAVDVPKGKPAPDIFLEAARRLGVDPSQCLVLEDSVPGVKAAKDAGMACIALPALQNGNVEAEGRMIHRYPQGLSGTTPEDPGFARADMIVAGGAACFTPGMITETWRFA